MVRMFVYLVFSFLVLSGTYAGAADFRIVTEEWPPFNFHENGKPTGFAVELLQEALKHAGKKIPVRFLPWERAYKIALEEPDVLIFTISRTPEREELFKWVSPIYSQRLYLYKYKKRTDIRLKTINDAKQYKIGTSGENDAGTSNLVKLGFVKGKNLDMVYESDEQNVKKLVLGRDDLMIAPQSQMKYTIKAAGYNPDDFTPTVGLPDVDEFYFAFSRTTSDTVVKGLQRALQRLKTDGTYEKLQHKYFK